MLNVAVVGATGAVGETILRVLEERKLPIDTLGRSRRGRAQCGAFRGRPLDVRATADERVARVRRRFFRRRRRCERTYAPALVEARLVVIDNSATFRMRDGVPLIVPEVNPEACSAEHRLFPVANCTAIMLCTALAPIRDAAGLRTRARRDLSGGKRRRPGRARRAARAANARSRAAKPSRQPSIFPRPLARNVVPQVGAFDASGYSGEERKVRDETRKMLGLPELLVSVTAVRVPVRTAHTEAVFVETERADDRRRARRGIRRGAGHGLPSRRHRDAARRRGHRRRARRAFARGDDDRTPLRAVVRGRSAAQGRGDQRGADSRAAARARDTSRA